MKPEFENIGKPAEEAIKGKSPQDKEMAEFKPKTRRKKLCLSKKANMSEAEAKAHFQKTMRHLTYLEEHEPDKLKGVE